MKTVAKSGVIVYSDNIALLSTFYVDMLAMQIIRETQDFVSLANEDINIIVHVPPIDMPQENFNRVKIFVTVESLRQAQSLALKLGGQTLQGEWANPIFKVCNIADPEGNHIQLRQFLI